MVSSMKERYEELKKYPNMLLDYNAILAFYPDYYKIKENLKHELFLAKRKIDKAFEKNYRSSDLYNKLKEENFSEEEIYEYTRQNKDEKYNYLELVFNTLLSQSIDLCDLIDYIGHYPDTYPVPLEEEKNPNMEKLLEKYDIIVRYHLDDDLGEMQIQAEDIVRIIEKLEDNLGCIKQLKLSFKDENFINNWFCIKNITDEERKEMWSSTLDKIKDFPLSESQKQGKSKREKGKHYLRVQHGPNII